MEDSMHSVRKYLVPIGAAAVMALAGSSWAAGGGSGGTGGPGNLDPDHADIVIPISSRLDETGHELRLTANQQAAWDNYVSATRALYEQPNLSSSNDPQATAGDAQVREQRRQQWNAASDELKANLNDTQREILDRSQGDLRVHGG
jgi:hypothetical protein